MFLNRAQLAGRWNISISTVKRFEKNGKLNPRRFGPRGVRFNLAEIETIEKQA